MIKKKFLSFTHTQDGHRIPVATQISWDPDAPLTVRADFVDPVTSETVTWYVSRDLLTEGVASARPIGVGDVKVRRTADQVVLCLNAGDHLDMVLPFDRVSGFLEDAGKVCKPGSNEEADLVADSLDRLIAQVYEEGDRA